MEIVFIPGKNIGSKSIKDGNITAHFEVPDTFDANGFINKPLRLSLDNGVEYDASISQEWASYYYNGTHKSYAIKLDIILPAIRAMGLIFESSKIELSIYTEEY